MIAGILVLMFAGGKKAAKVAQANRHAAANVIVPQIRPVAAPLELDSINGGPEVTIQGRPHIVVFYSTTCTFCRASIREWERMASAVCKQATIMFVSDENILEQARFWDSRGGRKVMACHNAAFARLEHGTEARTAYGVPGTPTHVVVDASGRIVAVYAGRMRRAARTRLVSYVGENE